MSVRALNVDYDMLLYCDYCWSTIALLPFKTLDCMATADRWLPIHIMPSKVQVQYVPVIQTETLYVREGSFCAF